MNQSSTQPRSLTLLRSFSVLLLDLLACIILGLYGWSTALLLWHIRKIDPHSWLCILLVTLPMALYIVLRRSHLGFDTALKALPVIFTAALFGLACTPPTSTSPSSPIHKIRIQRTLENPFEFTGTGFFLFTTLASPFALHLEPVRKFLNRTRT